MLYAKARSIGLSHLDSAHIAIVGIEVFHRKKVEGAITSGRQVPIEVLSDYASIIS